MTDWESDRLSLVSKTEQEEFLPVFKYISQDVKDIEQDITEYLSYDSYPTKYSAYLRFLIYKSDSLISNLTR